MRETDVIDQLGPQVRRAVELLIASLDRADEDGKLLAGASETVLYEAAVTVMMRLAFLFMAEQRGLLATGEPDLDSRYAISTLWAQLEAAAAAKNGGPRLEGGSDAWPRVLATFRAVSSGARQARSAIGPNCSKLFDPNRYPFLEAPLRINNRDVLNLLRSLQQVERRGETHHLNFGSLDIENLGRIYESLLDYTAKRITDPLRDGNTRGSLQVTLGSARSSSGAHYTPRALTERTVEYALAPLVYIGAADGHPRQHWKLRPADELLDLKVCDITCGSGAFLIQACRYLSERLVEAWDESGESVVRKARRLVAERCLYGVDKNPLAVELAKLSLWLFAGAKSELFTFLDHCIRCGDSLIDRSFDGFEAESPFDWQLEFPEVFSDRGGFDAIIGNPPYVSLYARESQSANFADEFNAYAKQHFSRLDGMPVLTGRVNTYLLFLVRSLQLLNPTRGVAALVLPDTILTNESYEPMRRALIDSRRLMRVVRYQNAMFSSAAVGTAIVVCGAPAPRRHVTLVDELGNNAATIEIREPCTAIAERPMCSWLPQTTSHIARVALPFHGTVPIGEFAFVKDGINPGSKQTREWLLTDEPDDDPSLRLCMEGNWIRPFRIARKRLWVRYDPSRLTREERKAGASLREHWIFDSPKIVYRQTAPYIAAAIDHEGLCARNSVHSIVLKDHDETVLYALVAFLNSDACRAYYQSFTGETRKTFPQVHISSVKRLRVPERILDASHRDSKRLAQLAKSISSSSDYGDAVSNADVAAVMKRMNDLVARIVARIPTRPASVQPLHVKPDNAACNPV